MIYLFIFYFYLFIYLFIFFLGGEQKMIKTKSTC